MNGSGYRWLHGLECLLAAQVGDAGGAWKWQTERMRRDMQVIQRRRTGWNDASEVVLIDVACSPTSAEGEDEFIGCSCSWTS